MDRGILPHRIFVYLRIANFEHIIIICHIDHKPQYNITTANDIHTFCKKLDFLLHHNTSLLYVYCSIPHWGNRPKVMHNSIQAEESRRFHSYTSYMFVQRMGHILACYDDQKSIYWYKQEKKQWGFASGDTRQWSHDCIAMGNGNDTWYMHTSSVERPSPLDDKAATVASKIILSVISVFYILCPLIRYVWWDSHCSGRRSYWSLLSCSLLLKIPWLITLGWILRGYPQGYLIIVPYIAMRMRFMILV